MELFKIVVYKNCWGNWEWSILPAAEEFRVERAVDGCKPSLRRAIRAAKKQAKADNKYIAYTYMERNNEG